MDLKAKAILLGNPTVGKTSLLSRYIDNIFPKQYNPTIGANFLVKGMRIESHPEIENLSVYWWDLGGQIDKIFLTEYYFVGANGAMIIFDITEKDSFKNLEFWINQMKRNSGEIPFIIVGNKIDKDEHREVKEDVSKKIKNLYNCHYIETSAKSNLNVDKAFELLIELIIKRYILT